MGDRGATREQDLITPEELAEEWQISVKTLANQRSAGVGPPYFKINGGLVRYSRKACAEYVASSLVDPRGGAA